MRWYMIDRGTYMLLLHHVFTLAHTLPDNRYHLAVGQI